ncbi:hypothetical protein [Zobellia laminariae]|uniref:hypothetical protein n=1 Tax=Zobellia laminariae TaxID=248906 RepID=UPI003EF8F189
MKTDTIPYNSIREIIAVFFSFFISLHMLQAQVKIGENSSSIHPTSVLELESTSRALVLTRLTDAQMLAITPLQGAIVYNVDQECIYYYNATVWRNLCSEEEGSDGDNATLIDNGNDTYTFTDTNGIETLISFNSTNGNSLTGEPGSIFFADTDMTATHNNGELFWDNINNNLGIGTNTNLNNKLTVNGNIGATQLLLNNANQEATPLIIRGSEADQSMIAFQDGNLGRTLFDINFRGAGLNIDEVNKEHRLFMKILGGLGIETREPTETLDVAGTLRVRELAASQTNDNFVTVDANGVFHKSVTNSLSGKSSTNSSNNFSGRWTNNLSKIGLKFGKTIAPIFTIEQFKDGDNSIYEVKGNSLVVKLAGLYDIRANLSLIGANTSTTGQIATTSAKININGSPVGAIFVAANNGSTNKSVISSILVNELLSLKANDVITIVISTDSFSDTIYISEKDTSNFSITKFK